MIQERLRLVGRSSVAAAGAPVILESSAVIDGVRTRVLEVKGSGPPVLLLHGFTDSADTWRPVLAELASVSRAAVAVDLPGAGQAERLPRGPVLQPLDRFVASFVQRYGRDSPVVLAGNSLGGMLALRAAQDPRVPLAAVSGISPAGLVYSPHIERMDTLTRGMAPFLRIAYRAPVPPALIRFAAAQLYSRRLARGQADPELARLYASHFRGLADVRRWGAIASALTSETALGCYELERIERPVLLIWGRRDPICTVRGARIVLDAVPSSRLVLFDSCGHCTHLERPSDVAALLAALPALPDRDLERT